MANVSYFTTYGQNGQMEDVQNMITSISPYDTPFTSLIGTEKCHNTTFSWQEDDLRAGAANAKVEGADAAIITLGTTTEKSNVTQIVAESFQISGTADAIKTYGRAKETAYNLAKTMKELKKDVEFAFVGSSQAKALGSADDTNGARKTASYDQLMWNNGATDDTAAGNVVFAGTKTTPAAMTEDDMLSLHQKIFTQGGSPDTFMVSPTAAVTIAGFAETTNRHRVLNDKISEVVNVVDVYQSPFGRLNVVINRHQVQSDALMFDPKMWSAVYLRTFTHHNLGRTGDSEMHMVVGEVGLKCKAERSAGRIRFAS